MTVRIFVLYGFETIDPIVKKLWPAKVPGAKKRIFYKRLPFMRT